MKEQFHIVLITVGLFAAGLLMGIWTQRTRPIPAPPAPVLGEFGPLPEAGMRAGRYAPGTDGFAVERFAPGHPATVATINRNIAELEPRIKAFQGEVDAVEKDFHRKLDKLLMAEQRKKLASIEAEEWPVTVAPGPPPPPQLEIGGQAVAPAPPSQQGDAGQQFVVAFQAPVPMGGWRVLSMIIYQPSLDHLIRELKLDSSQHAAVKELMIERRTKLLTLIDNNPPPTLGFGEALP
jgi:hypothetical protein